MSALDKPYPVIQFTKDVIAILSPTPAIYYKGTEHTSLCKECDGKCVKFYRKLVCSNCGNEYSAKNIEFPINALARRTLTRVVKHLANRERNRTREQIRSLLSGERKHE